MYQALNALRPDGAQVYKVHELNLRRDVVSITFQDGVLAFFPPMYGRVTGAVFTGLGHIVATPRDAGERRSLAQFLNVPLLDQEFQSAYLRFTDNTAEEIEKISRKPEPSPRAILCLRRVGRRLFARSIPGTRCEFSKICFPRIRSPIFMRAWAVRQPEPLTC